MYLLLVYLIFIEYIIFMYINYYNNYTPTTSLNKNTFKKKKTVSN